MRWQDAKLYRALSKQNSIGQFKKVYVEFKNLEIVTNEKLFTTVINDVMYRKFEVTAITKFKDFNIQDEYIIEIASHKYGVTSFNTSGRYTQLLLQESSAILERQSHDIVLDGTLEMDGQIDLINQDGVGLEKTNHEVYLNGGFEVGEVIE